MSYKIILYVVVLTTAAGLGFLTSYHLAGAPDPETIARPGAIETQARAAAAQAAADIDQQAELRLPNLAGGDNSLTDWQGKTRLINFWATWCAPCRREIPLLKTLQAEQPVADLQVLGIAFDELDAVRAYADEAEFNYPILVGEEAALQAAESYGLDLMALPFTLIVAPDGTLLNAHVGEIDETEAAAIIEVLQALGAGEITVEAAREKLAG